VVVKRDGLLLKDEGTPSFARGSHPQPSTPSWPPRSAETRPSPHRGCGLCLFCRESFPAAGSRMDSGKAGGAAGREPQGGRGERPGGRETAAVTKRGPLPPWPPHYNKKEGPGPPGLGRELAPELNELLLPFPHPFRFCTLPSLPVLSP
jgi:hypothetical protein